MIDLYYWTTPNGHKITLFLEEAKLPYTIHTVDIRRGEQFNPDFLAFAPNNRIPAIIDHAPQDGGAPITVFESGAILLYLADKIGAFLPTEPRARIEATEWLMWQMGGLGPMAGQNHHFNAAAPEKIPYAMQRYINETARLYGVLDKRLAAQADKGSDFIAGHDYSIADMACYPWIVSHKKQSQNLDDFPHVKAWYTRISERPATIQAYEIAENINANAPEVTPEDALTHMTPKRSKRHVIQ